jgi:prophage tail gpP-like protein
VTDKTGPIALDFKSAITATGAVPGSGTSLRTFDSYSFERNILSPGAAFRFTAPGVTAALRQSIRSGDLVELFAIDPDGNALPIATGIIDETDTHVMPNRIEYVLTGRDMLGQLVDNAAVDSKNAVIQAKDITLDGILQALIANTRIPAQFQINPPLPNGQILFQTNPGETKISVLQRYLEFTNCLIWCAPNGQLVIGKPNMASSTDDSVGLKLTSKKPQGNNLLEARVRRGTNLAIRQITTQLQTLSIVPPTSTVMNNDKDMQKVASQGVGRSVFEMFSYGQGTDTINVLTQVGNSNSTPYAIGTAMSNRQLAKENMKIIDVEAVVRGHLNGDGDVYDIDQVYDVQIDADAVAEPMYVYSVAHELTLEHGRISRLRLCRLGSIVAYNPIQQGYTQ